ncbi:RIP metalloprotease RseP [Thermodesulfobacteriota bacterium]
MEYVIGLLILLGVLIFFHELGHFVIAKLLGVKVLKFSLGFGPAIISRKWGQTEYMLSWVPLGGYVKLLEENPDSEDEVEPGDEDKCFQRKPLLARMAIIAAGPIANYVLAIILLSIGYMAGFPVPTSKLGKVLDNSPAMEAGLKAGDRVVAVEGKEVWRWDDMRSIIEKSPDKAVNLKVERDGETRDVSVTPRLSKDKDAFGNPTGRIGVTSARETVELGITGSIYEGTRLTFQITGMIFETLVKLVKREISAKNLSGPISIAQASGESLRAGFFSFIFVLAFISINLAIINLLPIPILDGGHLLFFLIEAVTRRPVTGKVREIATQAGFLFIIFLMVLVFYNDISRLIQGRSLLAPP